MTPRRRAVAAALAATVAAAVSACTSLPTSGTVQASDVHVSAAPGVDVIAQGPLTGAEPRNIVEGFLGAQAAGFVDNFDVARQYLAGDARGEWKPLAGVVVASSMTWSVPADGEVTVDVGVQGRVDGAGVFTEAPPDAHETVTFGMRQDSSKEWRIATAPPGLLLSAEDFQLLFRPTPVYFLSADKAYLVPDTRFVPARSKVLPTAVMDALLAGPAEWLRDGVVTEVPDGTQLQFDSVTVDGKGTAQVSLGSAGGLAKVDKPLLFAQIEASLTALPGVTDVQVEAGGVPIVGSPNLPGKDGGPTGPLTYLADGKLMQLDGATVSQVRGVGSLDGLAPSAPATGPEGTRVLLSGGSSLVTVPTGSAPAQTLLSAQHLVAPSVDRFGWAWTSDGTHLLAAKAGQQPVTVRADWLADRTVRSVRVAADGTRVAIVAAGPDGTEVDVAVATRDDSGAPIQLGAPVRAGASLTDATQVVWSDGETLGVLGRTPAGSPTVNVVPVAGPTTHPAQIADVTSIAGGSPLVVATKSGVLWRYVSTWVAVTGVSSASDPSYPG